MNEKENAEVPLLAFTGGGTGGHIYPGLAVIHALRESGFHGRVVWIGSNKALDRSIVEKEGVEYFAIPSGKLRRSLSLENIADAFRVIAGYCAARRLLASLKPVLLFSKGGYVSVPPCRAAASLGIPYFTHESDGSPGLATRLNAQKAAKILVSWPRTAAMIPTPLQAKTEVVGNPVRPSLFDGNAAEGRALLTAPPDLPIIFFVGGSQGSRQVNDIVAGLRPSLEGKAFIVHQTGRELFDPLAHAEKPGYYKALPYIGDEMMDILAASTIVSGRAGAGTIWESAALGKPMVLIPLAGRGTRGDQVENAEMAEEAGAAICLTGEKATPENTLAAIRGFLEDPAARARASSAGMALCKAHKADNGTMLSAHYIARLILDQVGQPTGRQT
ncbi:MAG: undecaprenyldiphospho-muramoylpentapeptide beta-N-acetylglucosaminyltransferase [Rectinemataceae bacterium]|nr:undecaprenyldiphospho-muramoylpentapeptide beta-N-acetylglucosaminyltransferase [Rectinemataceae bacterium]